MASIDGEAAAVAARQRGLLTRAQVLTLGFSPSAIDRRVRSRQWHRVASGVYRVAGTPMVWSDKVLAVCLATGGVASHRTAAVLLGVGGIRPGRVEVTVRRGGNVRRADARVHQSGDVDLFRSTQRDGIPVTPCTRLAVDLGAVVPYTVYEHSMTQLLGDGAITWPGMVDALLRHARPGRPGVGALRTMVTSHLGAEVDESALERAFFALYRTSPLPRPERQVEVFDAQGFIARVDFAYPNLAVAIELDSRAFHLNRRAFEEDRRKRNRLELAGWTVLEFTWEAVLRDPAGVLAQIEAALRQAQALHQLWGHRASPGDAR